MSRPQRRNRMSPPGLQEEKRAFVHAPAPLGPDMAVFGAAIDRAFARAARAAVAQMHAQGRATRGTIEGKRVEFTPAGVVRAVSKAKRKPAKRR